MKRKEEIRMHIRESLEKNPFYLLQVSCFDDRRAIMDAADEMSFSLDQNVCIDAQNALLSLNRRLSAELEWFPVADRQKCRKLAECIQNRRPLPSDWQNALCQLNAEIYNYSLVPALETDPDEQIEKIEMIAQLFALLDPVETAEMINQSRKAAKMGETDPDQVAEGINELRTGIRKEISGKLAELDEIKYVQIMTSLAEKMEPQKSRYKGVILSDLLDDYEIRIQPRTEVLSQEIENLIEHVREEPTHDTIISNLQPLIGKASEWDFYSQPLQLRSRISGLAHENSKRMGVLLRDYAIWLNYEKKEGVAALLLSGALKNIFANLTVLDEQLSGDMNVLNEYIIKYSINNPQGIQQDPIFSSIVSLAGIVKMHPEDAQLEEFMSSVRSLRQAFQDLAEQIDASNTVRGETFTAKTSENQFDIAAVLMEGLSQVARTPALWLHNKLQQSEDAVRIMTLLKQEFEDCPDIAAGMEKDLEILQEYIRERDTKPKGLWGRLFK